MRRRCFSTSASSYFLHSALLLWSVHLHAAFVPKSQQFAALPSSPTQLVAVLFAASLLNRIPTAALEPEVPLPGGGQLLVEPEIGRAHV